MSGELTTAKTHLAALQNEVTSLRQREADLSNQLSKVTSEAEKYKNELAHTKDSHKGQFTKGYTFVLRRWILLHHGMVGEFQFFSRTLPPINERIFLRGM